MGLSTGSPTRVDPRARLFYNICFMAALHRSPRLFSLSLACLLPATLCAAAGQIELLSRAVPGTSPDTAFGVSTTSNSSDDFDLARPSRVSADGRWVAFVSQATDLVDGQIDQGGPAGTPDVFLRDRVTGSSILVSHAAAGATTAGNSDSNSPSVSPDGRYVAFLSDATNLVSGQVDTPPVVWGEQEDTFLFDRVTQTTVLVSRAAGSAATATGRSYSNPLVSDDGAYVAFLSSASNLVPGQTQRSSGSLSLFLFHRDTGTVSLVSHPVGDPSTALPVYHGFALSADGHRVLFSSGAPDVVAGQSGAPENLFLYDATPGESTLVSHAAGSPTTGATADLGGFFLGIPSLSADGDRVVFTSRAVNLVTGVTDDPDTLDVFLWQRSSDTMTLVSRSSGAPVRAVGGSAPVISHDGSTVAFLGTSADLLSSPGAVVDTLSIFRYAVGSDTMSLASPAAGSPTHSADNGSTDPALSWDGSIVLFHSFASDLVSGQNDPAVSEDLFLFDSATGLTSLVDHTAASTVTPLPDSFWTGIPFLSGDGRWVAFSSPSTNIVAGLRDLNEAHDIFLYDRTSQANTAVSLHGPASASATPLGESSVAALSADGRFTAFLSSASNVLPGLTDANGNGLDLILYDASTATRTLVSHASGFPTITGNGAATEASLSADGRWIAFISSASNLAAGQNDTNGAGDLFLQDRTTGITTLVSHAAGAPATAANAGSARAVISRDGNRIAFVSSATDLVSGQTDINGGEDTFLWDRTTGTTVLVSHANGSATTAGEAGPATSFPSPVLSADGRYVAFCSAAKNLVPGQSDGNDDQDVFLYDRTTGGITLVTRAAGTPATTAAGFSFAPVISADGRFVAYQSSAGDLVPGQTPPMVRNIFLWDRLTGETTLVSHAAGAALTPGGGYSDSPSMDDAGRFVTFISTATNLVPGQIDNMNSLGSTDIFLWDRATGTTALVSHALASAVQTGNLESLYPKVSGDGSYVAFYSFARDLLPSFTPGTFLYLYRQATGSVAPVGQAATANLPANLSNHLLEPPRISQTGHEVAWTGLQTNLVDLDFNGLADALLFTDPPVGHSFFTLPPCRLLDTRQPQDGPALATGTVHLTLAGHCGIPATATAVVLNITVTGSTGGGHLIAYPGDQVTPLTSSINFSAGQTRANNAVLSVSEDGQGSLAVTAAVTGSGTVHLILDVTGYFE